MLYALDKAIPPELGAMNALLPAALLAKLALLGSDKAGERDAAGLAAHRQDLRPHNRRHGLCARIGEAPCHAAGGFQTLAERGARHDHREAHGPEALEPPA